MVQVYVNKKGDPLLEIVFDPDIRSGIEAAEYTGELQRIVRHILKLHWEYISILPYCEVIFDSV